MIQKLNWKIPIKSKEMGKYVISSTGKGEAEYFREPTKREMFDKLNEIIQKLNDSSN